MENEDNPETQEEKNTQNIDELEKENNPNEITENDDIKPTDVVEFDNSEEEIPEENLGIKISNDAVATYAGIAVSEVKGVYGKGGTFSGITEALSGKKNITKGIKVEVDEKTAKIDVNIVVIYGARIPDVAFEIQSRVKKTVENMTGLMVSEVNVNVLGVHPIDKEDEAENNVEEDI